MCFDEIITGFRVSLGGCSEFYKIYPDLVTYGKTIGGGLPVGVLAGNNSVMDVINDKYNPVFMGGTFSANPIVMSSSKAVLSYLIANQGEIYSSLNSNVARIKSAINEFCIERNFGIRIIGVGSMFRIVFTDYPILSRRDRDLNEKGKDFQDRFYFYLLNKHKVFVNSNRIMFISMAGIDKVPDMIIESLIDTIIHMYNS